MDAAVHVLRQDVLCNTVQTKCPNEKPPVIRKNECCAVCTDRPLLCALIKCAAQPEFCSHNQPPFIPTNECCPVCIRDPDFCSLVKCEHRGLCSNGKLPVTPLGECCSQCPYVDCSGVRCVAPTKFCKKDQIPRPKACCATCKLDCAAISCVGCSAEQVAINSPNSCCPNVLSQIGSYCSVGMNKQCYKVDI